MNGDWHAAYRARYAELKRRGVSFFPHAVAKDTAVAALVLAVLATLAWKVGAGLEDLADPTDATYNPRPEWYFLFLFQALKLFPGRLEFVGAMLLPGLGVGLLFLLPFLDRGPGRRVRDRPVTIGTGLAAMAGIAFLTWQGARSPLLNPLTERDPQAQEGHRLYLELRCAYCHAIGGKGGTVGPDLARIAGAADHDFLVRHFRNPQATTPGSVMPRMNLLEDEIQALTAYVLSLGGGAAFTKDAPRLFAASCATCHKIGSEGGEIGPDLSTIGQVREAAYLRRYIADPAQLNPSSAMPGFKGDLTDVQIEDLARYLAHQR